MTKVIVPGILLLFFSMPKQACAQQMPVADTIIKINQQIDDAVVSQNVQKLDSLYASDFVFSHGTGLVEGKGSWLKTVAATHYLSRTHDSTSLEVHPGLVILRGILNIVRQDKDKTDRYQLHYLRIYARRTLGWQLVSHVTTREVHWD